MEKPFSECVEPHLTERWEDLNLLVGILITVENWARGMIGQQMSVGDLLPHGMTLLQIVLFECWV